jgi:hypothetical protein
VWVATQNNCLISSQIAKRSIEDITAEQATERSRDVLRTRLAV